MHTAYVLGMVGAFLGLVMIEVGDKLTHTRRCTQRFLFWAGAAMLIVSVVTMLYIVRPH